MELFKMYKCPACGDAWEYNPVVSCTCHTKDKPVVIYYFFEEDIIKKEQDETL